MNLSEAMDRLEAALPDKTSINVKAEIKRPSAYYPPKKELRKNEFTVAVYGDGVSLNMSGPNLAGLVASVIQRLGPIQDASAAAECVTSPGNPILAGTNPQADARLLNDIAAAPLVAGGQGRPDYNPD